MASTTCSLIDHIDAKECASWTSRLPEPTSKDSENEIPFSNSSASSACEPHNRIQTTGCRCLYLIPWEEGQAWVELPHCELWSQLTHPAPSNAEHACSTPFYSHNCSTCDLMDCCPPINFGVRLHVLQAPVMLTIFPITSKPRRSIEVPLAKIIFLTSDLKVYA